MSDADVVVLNQNQPNPFAEQTIVTYNIPASSNSAQIMFYYVNGKLVLNQTINGKTSIDTNSLPEGVYNINIKSNNSVTNKKLVIVR